MDNRSWIISPFPFVLHRLTFPPFPLPFSSVGAARITFPQGETRDQSGVQAVREDEKEDRHRLHEPRSVDLRYSDESVVRVPGFREGGGQDVDGMEARDATEGGGGSEQGAEDGHIERFRGASRQGEKVVGRERGEHGDREASHSRVRSGHQGPGSQVENGP